MRSFLFLPSVLSIAAFTTPYTQAQDANAVIAGYDCSGRRAGDWLVVQELVKPATASLLIRLFDLKGSAATTGTRDSSATVLPGSGTTSTHAPVGGESRDGEESPSHRLICSGCLGITESEECYIGYDFCNQLGTRFPPTDNGGTYVDCGPSQPSCPS